MNINPGEFRNKILFQKKINLASDDVGNPVSEWIDDMVMFAKINGLFGEEYWAAVANGQQDTITFTIRFNQKINALVNGKKLIHYRILHNGVFYEIQNFDNVSFANKIIKIKAVRREYQD